MYNYKPQMRPPSQLASIYHNRGSWFFSIGEYLKAESSYKKSQDLLAPPHPGQRGRRQGQALHHQAAGGPGQKDLPGTGRPVLGSALQRDAIRYNLCILSVLGTSTPC